MFIFPVQLTTSRIGNLTRLIHTLLYVMTIHTYIHTSVRRLHVVLHVVYKNDWSSAFLPGCACVHLPTMTHRIKPPHTLVSVLYWLWYCRATALSALLANLTLLLGKNTLPFPAFGNLNFVSPPHRRAYTSIPKSSPNIRFPRGPLGNDF